MAEVSSEWHYLCRILSCSSPDCGVVEVFFLFLFFVHEFGGRRRGMKINVGIRILQKTRPGSSGPMGTHVWGSEEERTTRTLIRLLLLLFTLLPYTNCLRLAYG